MSDALVPPEPAPAARTAAPALAPSLLGRGAERVVREVLERADVRVDGARPEDIEVVAPRFYARVLRDGALGLGESYVDGDWECGALDELTAKLCRGGLNERPPLSPRLLAHVALAKVVNLQSRGRAFEVGERHYDLGNDLYAAMLDRRMLYTCALWADGVTDLDGAQVAKLERVCRKIGLAPGMRVLDLGCGWGGFARYAAEVHGARVTALTVSRAQVELARERCAGLPVDVALADYRQARGTFDAVVSIGLMEHVGTKNYGTYMEVADRCLAPGGIAFVHTIGRNRSATSFHPWFHKYIFPNAQLPSVAQLARAMEGRFVIEELANIGPHYDPTLMAWYRRFEAAWPDLCRTYDERFRRMWTYYLLSCAGAFRARVNQLFQIVMTRPPRHPAATGDT